MILLNPGPVTLSERVKKSLLKEDLCHRESEFSALQSDIRERLVRVYPESAKAYSAVLITGSGTSAVEMMVGSLVPKNGKALVVANGVYGERMAAMLRMQGKAFELAQGEWVSPIVLNAVEDFLKKDQSITHVLAVHHETTTGRLNAIDRLGQLCKKYSRPLLLDAVSSFGGEEIKFEEWNLQACAATANKCLHGVPGLSFVIAQKSVLDSLETGATSLYLDLKLQYREQEKKSSAFTHSVQCCYALKEALSEFEEQGGWKGRHEKYSNFSAQIRKKLKSLNVPMLLENETEYSSILQSFKMPAGFKYIDLHDFLKSKGYTIYAGQGKFSGEVFRVAVMGDLNQKIIDDLLIQFERFFKKST